eukprot:TRINITY_DN3879_c0_g1_i1.p1 TRINITY_DN3879_c0_g1~~TRINITY_DN3879_c0_g1_i1.p1  ORF type:complete len:138 (+),score=8.57 TRINITY_DN3879_c0_g1_i1:120-533(+)
MELYQQELNHGSTSWPSVLDKASLDMSKCASAATFDHQTCLDFLFYSKVIKTFQDTIFHLPSNFSMFLFVIYLVLSLLWLQENVFKCVRLHFDSSELVDEIWSKFDNVKFDKAFLTLFQEVDIFKLQLSGQKNNFLK